MARRARVVVNRAALDEVKRGLADGMFALASAVHEEAARNAPDAPPYGEGLVTHGGAAVWVDGRKVHETEPLETPRDLRTSDKIVGVVGFAFPGRFQETGTVHHGAQPFITPAAGTVIGRDAEVVLSKAMERRIGRGRPK